MKYYYTYKLLLFDMILTAIYGLVFSWYHTYHHNLNIYDLLFRSVAFTITMRLLAYWSYRKTKKAKSRAINTSL